MRVPKILIKESTRETNQYIEIFKAKENNKLYYKNPQNQLVNINTDAILEYSIFANLPTIGKISTFYFVGNEIVYIWNGSTYIPLNTAITPLPSNLVNFNTLNPNTPGAIFTPDVQLDQDTLYVSDIDTSFWTSNGSIYKTYTPSIINNTAWNIRGTNVDAGNSKTLPISRSGQLNIIGSINNDYAITIKNNGTTLSSGLLVKLGPSSDSNSFPISIFRDTVKIFQIANNGQIISKNYTFPLSDGTANQFLKTNGSGILSFANAGLDYFTDSQNTSGVNSSIYANILSAVSASTNADYIIKPKGNGAISTRTPDGTGVGGNKRGRYSSDFQSSSANALDKVVSGDYGFGGGDNNQISGLASSGFGSGNVISGAYGFGGGFGNSALGTASTVFGYGNICSDYSFVVGYLNTGAAQFSLISGYNQVTTGSENANIGSSSTVNGNYTYNLGYQNLNTSNIGLTLGNKAYTFGLTGRFVTASGGYIGGDSQSSKFILRGRTTDATPTIITTDGTAAGSNNQLILQNQNYIRYKGTLVAKESGTTNVASWDLDGSIVRGANAASTVLRQDNQQVVENIPLFGSPIRSADIINGGLSITVVGKVATNIQWNFTFTSIEVIYN